jgi:acyl carrier protein
MIGASQNLQTLYRPRRTKTRNSSAGKFAHRRVVGYTPSNSSSQVMPDNITEKVLELIADTKRIPREQVSPTSTFEELGLDSLDAINLVFEVESAFNISVPDSVANSMTSVPQVVEELRKILATPPTSQQLPPE